MSWELMTASAEHLPLVDQLSQQVWGYAMTPEHLHWRYFNNPVDDACITLAYDASEQRLVGFYAAIPMPMQLGKDQVIGAQVIDTMVHPDYQGKGLFGKMADHCFEAMAARGYEVLYGFPNKDAYGGCINRLNWHHTGQIPVWVRPLKWVGSYLPGCKALDGISHEAPSADAIDALLAQTDTPSRLARIHRSGAWMAWRYDPRGVRHISDHSKRGYFWHALYNKDESLEALCVWGILEAGDASLCEWHGVNDTTKSAVLADAVALAASKGLRLFRAYWHQPEDAKALLKHSFVPLPKKLGAPLIVHNLSARNVGGNLHQHASWRIVGGDMDTQ